MIISLSDLLGAPRATKPTRRHFIGGSDARIVMSADESALIRLWGERRGDVEPEDLSRVSSPSYSRLTRAAEPRTQGRRRRAAPSGGHG